MKHNILSQVVKNAGITLKRFISINGSADDAKRRDDLFPNKMEMGDGWRVKHHATPEEFSLIHHDNPIRIHCGIQGNLLLIYDQQGNYVKESIRITPRIKEDILEYIEKHIPK